MLVSAEVRLPGWPWGSWR